MMSNKYIQTVHHGGIFVEIGLEPRVIGVRIGGMDRIREAVDVGIDLFNCSPINHKEFSP